MGSFFTTERSGTRPFPPPPAGGSEADDTEGGEDDAAGLGDDRSRHDAASPLALFQLREILPKN